MDRKPGLTPGVGPRRIGRQSRRSCRAGHPRRYGDGNTQDGGSIPPIPQGGRAHGASRETQGGRAVQGRPGDPARGRCARRAARGRVRSADATRAAHAGGEGAHRFGAVRVSAALARALGRERRELDDAPVAAAPARPAAGLPAARGLDVDDVLRASRQGERADQGPALLRPGVAEEFARVDVCARVPAQRRVPEQDGRRGRDGSQDQEARQVRRAAVGRGVLAFELPGDQPEGAADVARNRRREPEGRPGKPAGRPAARQDHPDRRDGVRGRQERGDQRGRDRLREPAVPAHPVQAADAEGLFAPLPARSALHQQVLHPRPAARELVHPLRGGAGPHGVRGVVEEPAAVRGEGHVGRLPRGGRDPRHPRGPGDQRREADQHSRLLRWRHDHRERARGDVRTRRGTGFQRDADDRAARLRGHRRARRVHRRAAGAQARAGSSPRAG